MRCGCFVIATTIISQLTSLAGKCPVESCKFSAANIGICSCAQCDGQGVLIIDGSTGGAGIWRIACNSCPAVFTLQPERKILRVSLVPAAQFGGCENCGSNLVSVETTKDHELPFGGHQYDGSRLLLLLWLLIMTFPQAASFVTSCWRA